MERRKFGNTNLEISAISLGCWPFGVDWWGHYTDEDGIRLMKFAQDRGITFFDNGDAYGNGRAETMFGKFLKTTRRDRIEIGGKFGYDFYNDPGEVGSHKERKQDFSPKFMRFALEQSLKRRVCCGKNAVEPIQCHACGRGLEQLAPALLAGAQCRLGACALDGRVQEAGREAREQEQDQGDDDVTYVDVEQSAPCRRGTQGAGWFHAAAVVSRNKLEVPKVVRAVIAEAPLPARVE